MEAAQVPTTHRWIRKIWCRPTHIYTQEYYSATKKVEVLPSVTTCNDLEGIMLREISQIEDSYLESYPPPRFRLGALSMTVSDIHWKEMKEIKEP